MSERIGPRESREVRADRRAAMSHWGFEVSDWRENHTFRPLVFKPGIRPTGDVEATSARDLIAGKIEVSPDFIEKEWGTGEANKYRDGRKTNGGQINEEKY